MTVVEIIVAILALGLLIIVHEGGHYFVARWCKMRVERFSVGFGPAILKWQKRGETSLVDGRVVEHRGTIFQIAPVPLGGFVQITGMNPHEEFDSKDPNVYPNRPTWQRFVTIFAGPFTNLLFSIVLIFIVFAFAGMNTPTGFVVIDQVGGHVGSTFAHGSVAGSSGRAPGPDDGVLTPEDKILFLDNLPLTYSRTENVLRDRLQATEGRPVRLIVQRDGKAVPVRVALWFETKQKVYRLGVGVGGEQVRMKVGLGTATVEAAKYPWVMSSRLLSNLYDVVRGKVAADATGPVGITGMIHTSIKKGWVTALEFLAFLNVALGLFNLLPIPALDGGRLVFLGYELVTRRRPNPRIEAAVHMVGFVLLMLLLLVVSFKDIRRLL